MSKLPDIKYKHRICVICEGNEEHIYFKRLMEINVWNQAYEFIPINAKGASNIFARFQDAYNNNSYEIIIIFCDTDKSPYNEYALLKKKVNGYFGKRAVAQKIVIWANPCSMQIILSHFDDVNLASQGKKTNASLIKQLTGVDNYDAHEEQIKEICSQIYRRTYPVMKDRLRAEAYDEKKPGSSNIVHFLDLFEESDTKWIAEINKYLESDS